MSEKEPTGGEEEIGMEQETTENWKEATTLIDSRDEESVRRGGIANKFQRANPRPSDDAVLESRVVDGEYQVRWSTEAESESE
jgi:hypothetical protein